MNRRLAVRDWAGPCLILVINLAFGFGLFRLEYSRFLGSIEGAYIGISRRLLEHPWSLDWWPFWYGGVPFQNTYPPLVHMLTALLAAIAQVSPARAHHAVAGLFFLLGPLAVYALGRRLTRSFSAAMGGALAYSLVSPCIWLMPAIHADVGAWFRPRRLHTILVYGDTPHVAAVALLPLAVLLFDRAWEQRKAVRVVLAALGLAAVALTNWLGAFSLALALIAYVGTRLELTGRGILRDVGLLAVTGMLAYALVCPWLPPSTVLTIQRNSQSVAGTYDASAARLLQDAALTAAVVLASRLLLRQRASLAVQFALVFAVLLSGLTLSAEWFGISLVPQPQRYHLEMDLGICLLAGWLLGALYERWPQRAQQAVLAAMLLVSIGLPLRQYRAIREWTQPLDMTQTVEYQAAQWFRQNAPDSRAYVPGSVSFWMTAFSDTPLMNGGFDQGITNPVLRIGLYIVPSGDGAGERGGEVAATWMKAYGVNWIMAGGPRSREQYRPVLKPERFQVLGAPRWRNGDDAIWAVPRRSISLAQVVRRADLVTRPPANGIDLDSLNRYVGALEDPALPTAAWSWVNDREGHIRATLTQDLLVSVQISHHSGWHASTGGREVPVEKDGLGLMAIAPACAGPCDIRMWFDGGREMNLLRILCALTWIAALAAVAVEYRRGKALLR